VKDDLNGRVVGYLETYVRDPSQLRPDETEADLISQRSRWARVGSSHPAFELIAATDYHTGEQIVIARRQIHTTMPAAYNPLVDPDFQPKVGDFVFLDHEEGSIIPEGGHVVSHVNPDGSFHVGGNTAVWPHRVAGRLSSL
jgi:hypothetical protein